MKHYFWSILLMVSVITIGCDEKKADKVTNSTALATADFGVRGNCGMCKTTIEKAAKSVDGVASAEWNVDKKQITVAFDETETSTTEIHKAIAESGYDTDKMKGNESAYKSLPQCCKYDHSMKMNQ